MTIKQWFYRHPNLTFVGLVLVYAWMLYVTLDHFNDRRWGWAALGLIACVVLVDDLKNWWRKHL